MEKIVISVNPVGETKTDAQGFTGGKCAEKLRPIHEKLGTADTRDKDEMHMQVADEQTEEQHQHGHV